MARAGGRAGKVLSSGRMTGPVRITNARKRAAVRKVSTTSADSLCSTDSEDQVLVINKGLDRCAALLQDILQHDVKETVQPSTSRVPAHKVNSRPSTVKVKRSFPRKPTTASHVHKEIGFVRKSVSSGVCAAEKMRPCVNSEHRVAAAHSPVTQVGLYEHVQTQMSHPKGTTSQTNCNGHLTVSTQTVSDHGPEVATVFNCRLPTSTPTLSPQRPSNSSNPGHEAYNQSLPQEGAVYFQAGTVSVAAAQSVPTGPSYVPAPGRHCTAGSTCFQRPYQADMLSQLRNNENQIRESDLHQCIAAHLAQLHRSESKGLKFQDHSPVSSEEAMSEREGSRREGDVTSSEENGKSLDMAPVTERSCQTSFEKNFSKTKRSSPEKTEKKIKTLQYLLGEIKALVSDQDDGEALRLFKELEQTVSLLPAVVGSTNVHAEIALALQPLRSENAQLRRRLRILNQQLRDRERAEKASRSDDQNFELISLQSMNVTLQHQLNESQRSLESLQSKNEELLSIIDAQKEENRKFARITQEKEQEMLQLRQQSEIAATKVKIDVDEALGKMKSAQFKLDASEKENQILGITLRQRDTEVSRLRDLTRTLQGSMAKLLTDLSKDNAKCKPGSSLTKSMLENYERQLQSDQCPASTSIMSYLKRLEIDQVLPGTDTINPEKPATTKLGIKCVTSDIMDKYHQGGNLAHPMQSYSPEKHKTVEGSECGTLTGEEFKPDETTYLPLTSSPYKGQIAPSQRQMCTPPKADMASISAQAKLGEFGISQVGSNGEFGLKTFFTNAAKTVDQRMKPSVEASNTEQCSINVHSANNPSDARPPILQQMKYLQVGDPSDHSIVDLMCGKSDWSMSSFSTFTTHDEQDFRNGLAALDANIARLQKTLQSSVTKN